jgi:uncharacterized membrane protein HdeD (DUF308 family)
MNAEVLSRNWWLVVLRGVLGVLFGVTAFLWPDTTFVALVLLFGAYALVDGVFAVVTGFMRIGQSSRWWLFVLEGLVGVAAGVVTFLFPAIAGLALVYLVAAWSILTGILEVAAAIRLRREISNEWLLALSGVASVIFGVLVALMPGAGSLVLIWMLGAYALVFGILLIVLGFRLRTWHGPAGQRSTLQPS